MVTVMTVTGPIVPSQLGVTYAHEHLLGGPPDWSPDRDRIALLIRLRWLLAISGTFKNASKRLEIA